MSATHAKESVIEKYDLLSPSVQSDLNASGELSTTGIQELLNKGDIYETLYPLAKLHTTPDSQMMFLREVVEALAQDNDAALERFLKVETAHFMKLDEGIERSRLRKVIYDRGSSTKDDNQLHVEVAQLVQYHRYSFPKWREVLEDAAFQCMVRQVEPILPAYAIIVGLPYILRYARSCYLLNLKWLNFSDYCGLKLSIEPEPSVRLISRGERFADPYVLDDTIKHEGTLRGICHYLASCGHKTMRAHVLCDVRSDTRTFPIDGVTQIHCQ